MCDTMVFGGNSVLQRMWEYDVEKIVVSVTGEREGSPVTR